VRKREDIVQKGLKMKLTGLPDKGLIWVYLAGTIYMWTQTWVLEQLHCNVFHMPVLPVRNPGKGLGNLVFRQRTNCAFNRIRPASTG
jgi:hypothetical protein